MDYCSTVKLASAAKLAHYSLRSPIKAREVIFHMTRHEHAVVWPTTITPSPSPTPPANNYGCANARGQPSLKNNRCENKAMRGLRGANYFRVSLNTSVCTKSQFARKETNYVRYYCTVVQQYKISLKKTPF